jgi:sulfonate dioxygenase
MAPYLQEQTAPTSPSTTNIKSSIQPTPSKPLVYEPGRTTAETHENYPYDHLLPTFPDLKWDPLEEVPHHDKGLLGSPSFSSLLSTATSIQDLNPRTGTEVTGIDLASLSSAQKNDIARLIATRGVVFCIGMLLLVCLSKRGWRMFMSCLRREHVELEIISSRRVSCGTVM